MSGNVFGLFFLILGTTGIVNAIFKNQGDRWVVSHWDKTPYKKWNYRIHLRPYDFINNDHPYLNERNMLLHHQTDMKYKFQSKFPFNTGHDFPNFLPSHSQSSIFRFSKQEKNSNENLISSNFSGKNAFNSVEPRNEIQEDIYPDIDQKAIKREKISTAHAEMSSNNYENPTLSNADFNYEFLSMPMATSISELNSQLNEKQTESIEKFASKFNTDITNSENPLESEISHMRILQADATSEKSSSISHLEHGISESKKPFSTEDQHIFSTETSSQNKQSQITSIFKLNIFRKTESDNYSTDVSRSTSLKSSSDTSALYSKAPNTEEKDEQVPEHSSTSSTEIQSTNTKNSETESISHNSIPSKISEDSFDSFTSKMTEDTTTDVFSSKPKHSVGEDSVVSSSSKTEEAFNNISNNKTTTLTSEDLLASTSNAETKETSDTSTIKLMMSTDKNSVVSLAIIKETTNGISSTEPTISTHKESLVASTSILLHETSNDIITTKSTSSTSKDVSVSLKSTITKDFSSTNPTISERESILEAIPQDHVIKISSIRTVRVVISTMFLVIALIAMTTLSIYIIQVKRRTVKYDQVLLLP